MKIALKEITVRELVENYKDNNADGVTGFNNKLNIRPAYQREFIYKEQQRNAVIETVQKDFPLNVMYWADHGDDTYEVIDGQQRTISLCQYVTGVYSINGLYYHNLTADKKDLILDYKLMVYLCSGTESEKLEWFKTINIAGEKLTDQELRNAVYVGSWVTDAKRYFSKNGCAAYNIANQYMKGSPIRQDYLETAIDWISQGNINDYMSKHQHDATANDLWLYFQAVIAWVNATFTTYRNEMKGIEWGLLYNQFGKDSYDPAKLEAEISQLMMDDDVTNKKGIYPYVLSRVQKHLNIRAFTPNQKRESYERQEGICVKCLEQFTFNDMEADHITPWSKGGRTDAKNCQMLCRDCNRQKSDK